MRAWENLKSAAGVSPPKSSWECLKEAAGRQELSAIKAQQAHQRINDLGLPATQREASVVQDALADISEKLKSYLDKLRGFGKR